jgi:hypothetical protein
MEGTSLNEADRVGGRGRNLGAAAARSKPAVPSERHLHATRRLFLPVFTVAAPTGVGERTRAL